MKQDLKTVLEGITPLPWRILEADNDKVTPSVRIVGITRHGREMCIGRLDFKRDAAYLTHAANVLRELVEALKYASKLADDDLKDTRGKFYFEPKPGESMEWDAVVKNEKYFRDALTKAETIEI